MSGRKRICLSAGTALMTARALLEVQQKSLSALTAAVVFTYETTTAPRCSAFQLRSCSTVIESASEQPALMSGSRTRLLGERILAVSAMNETPQKTIVDWCAEAATRDRLSESPTWSATSWISPRS